MQLARFICEVAHTSTYSAKASCVANFGVLPVRLGEWLEDIFLDRPITFHDQLLITGARFTTSLRLSLCLFKNDFRIS